MSLLTIGVVWQFQRSQTLAAEAVVLANKNSVLTDRVNVVTTQFETFKADTRKALSDIADLRATIADINSETSTLNNRLNNLGKISKPVPNGSNSKQIKSEVNALSKDVFTRIENASKGKTNEK
ncbi:hypothetical protein Xoosp13_211 [Xanthomonas phage Xoo-sp13]|nr:hypothetical protein Xoosp13_211 [Xanthomonas phage Xoo-sp13]